MGDTCSLTFEIRTADLEKFKELARKEFAVNRVRG